MGANGKKGSVLLFAVAALGLAVLLAALLAACPAPLEGPPEDVIGPARPAAPAVRAGNQRLILSWDAAPLAQKYHVYCGTDETPGAAPAQTVAGTGAVITGLENGTAYYVWIRAENGRGLSPLSERAAGTPERLRAPAVLNVVPGNGSLTVNWTAVPGAESYAVYYNTTSEVPASPLSVVSGRTGTVIPELVLDIGTTCYVWVRAVNGDGDSELSAAGSVSVALTAPNQPTLTAGDRGFTVAWGPVGGAESYRVYVNTVNAVPVSPTKTGIAGTSVAMDGLANGTVYYVWVQAASAGGDSLLSAAAQVTLLSKAITDFRFTNPAATGVIDEAARTIGVIVPIGTNRNGLTPTITYSQSTTVSPQPGQAQNFNGTVTYTVTAGDGTSAQYAVTVTPAPPAAPAAPTVIDGDGKLSLSWAAVFFAVSYDVYCGTGSTMPETKNKTVSGTSVEITGLVNGTAYNVWIKAKAADGQVSAASPKASGKPVTPEGLYHTAVAGATKIGSYNLAGALIYLSANAVSGRNYFIVLSADEILAPQSLLYPNKTVGITLLGEGSRTVQLSGNGSLFTVGSKVTLALDSGITLKGHGSNNASLVLVSSGGNLIMRDHAVISGNTCGYSGGGGVSVYNGTFTMEGGEISGNNTHSSGGGGGGGVAVNGGTFTMKGGTISGNITKGIGGGVSVYSGGTFTMEGGEISGNTANITWGCDGGGGVHINDGFFTKKGGTIYGDTDVYHNQGDIENTAITGTGHAVSVNTMVEIAGVDKRFYGKKRNSTAGPGVHLYVQYSGGGTWTYNDTSQDGVGDTTANWE